MTTNAVFRRVPAHAHTPNPFERMHPGKPGRASHLFAFTRTIMHLSLLLAIASMLAACEGANAFELKVASPAFTVTVPNLPSIRLDAQPASNSGASSAMAGEDGTYKVTLLVTKAEKETTTRTCAGSFLRSLVARPGMPDRDNIYRSALDENTFLVLYILGAEGSQQLHAHLLSSASATHCIEAHFSRALRVGEDEDNWRNSFVGSHVQ